MSRTYRRKNFESTQGSSWGRQFTKLYGNYVGCKYASTSPESRYLVKIHYQKSGRELWEEVRYNHSDHSVNVFSASREYRNARMRENRMLAKQELFKFRMNPDYEPMVEEEPRSVAWDWR